MDGCAEIHEECNRQSFIVSCYQHEKLGSRDSVIVSRNRERAGWPRISESVPVRGTRCFSIPNCPDRFWTTSFSLSKRIGAVFPRLKLPWCVNGHSFLSTVKDKKLKYTSIFPYAFFFEQGKSLGLKTYPVFYVSEGRNRFNTEIITINNAPEKN
jgi:hypothetical protein